MRIIAGKYRRRKVLSSPGQVTRPITDRVKETLFERLEPACAQSRVLDLFAGTGTIGLEALSRGAKRVTFIENDRKALELLRKNVEALGCSPETLVWPADVRRCSFRPKGDKVAGFWPYDLIFFDPPYQQVPEIKIDSPLWLALRRLAREDVSAATALLVLRTPERVPFDLPPVWQVDWMLQMSHMEIRVCRKAPAHALTNDR